MPKDVANANAKRLIIIDDHAEIRQKHMHRMYNWGQQIYIEFGLSAIYWKSMHSHAYVAAVVIFIAGVVI